MKERESSTSRGAAVVAHLQVLHAGRDPARLAMKYRAMRRSFGDFVRWTCSLLFYLRARGVEMPPSPSIWICGDVHLGNFGIYEAEDALLRFDLNDFDKARIAPVCWISCVCSRHCVRRAQTRPVAMANHAVAVYAAALVKGADAASDEEVGEIILPSSLRWPTSATADGGSTTHRGRRRWTPLQARWRKDLPATPDERAALFSLAERLGQQFSTPSFFHPIDAAHRISGVGSLGLPRFLLGVAGEGKPDDLQLLDVKAARKPAFAVGLRLPCPPGVDDAERWARPSRGGTCGPHAGQAQRTHSTSPPTMPLIGLAMSLPLEFFSQTLSTITGGPTYRRMTRAPSQFDRLTSRIPEARGKPHESAFKIDRAVTIGRQKSIGPTE